MSSYHAAKSHVPLNQDFELNMASIIDCFTVLIAFMLISASFVSIGILDAGVEAAGVESTTTTTPQVHLMVTLRDNNTMTIALSGKERLSQQIQRNSGYYDELKQSVLNIKSRWKDLNTVTVSAEGGVPYNDIIRTMDTLRPHLPYIAVGGIL
ncbi:MAG: biopolymer transporter ExbD [Bdellovibrionota bacterium]